MSTSYNQYQATQVGTATPEKIMLMLYDGAINFSKIALQKIQNGDRAGKGVYIGKAQAIVAELMNTLDHEVGGELAKRLEQLYIYMIDEYIEANLNNSPKALENTVKILTILRDTWIEAVNIVKKQKEAAPRQGMRL